jgi:hypothetical protein
VDDIVLKDKVDSTRFTALSMLFMDLVSSLPDLRVEYRMFRQSLSFEEYLII